MPVAGGTTLKFEKAFCAQLKNLYLSSFLSNSISMLKLSASPDAYLSTCTEWSITKSAFLFGFIHFGSPPMSAIAFLMDAKSTIAGTPVKSCNSTLAGLNGTSILSSNLSVFQFTRFKTCSSLMDQPSYCLNTDSSNTLIEYGSLFTFMFLFSSRAFKL